MIAISNLLRLPGLIDVHVHLRDPGQTNKEDITTGTGAALSGGVTTVLDMPNNARPVDTVKRLLEKRAIASRKAVSDIGFHFGSVGQNLQSFERASRLAVGLKLFLNRTTGNYLLDAAHLRAAYLAWPKERVVLLHVEEDLIDVAIESMRGTDRPVHVCHVPGREVLGKIIRAKREGLPITCGVTPHHLFLTAADLESIGVYGRMVPSLRHPADQDYLWDHLDEIDVFESDHAPHTRREKRAGAAGVPGVETMLPLLLTAQVQGRVSMEQIVDMCFLAPSRIFGISTDKSTYIDVELDGYRLRDEDLHTKCGWSPFVGRELFGKVRQVHLRGQLVYEDGSVLARPGSGIVLN